VLGGSRGGGLPISITPGGAGVYAMKQGYEGIVVSGSMLVIALTLIAIVKWLF